LPLHLAQIRDVARPRPTPRPTRMLNLLDPGTDRTRFDPRARVRFAHQQLLRRLKRNQLARRDRTAHSLVFAPRETRYLGYRQIATSLVAQTLPRAIQSLADLELVTQERSSTRRRGCLLGGGAGDEVL
jgi:hypothetical protein